MITGSNSYSKPSVSSQSKIFFINYTLPVDKIANSCNRNNTENYLSDTNLNSLTFVNGNVGLF